MSTSLALTIEGDAIELRSMGQAVVDFSGLLVGLDAALAHDVREAVRWELESVSYSSPLHVVARAPSEWSSDDRAERVAAACLDGLQSLGEQARRPAAFDDEVLQRVESLGSLAGNGIRAIRIADPAAELPGSSVVPRRAIVTIVTAENAKAVLAAADSDEAEGREVVHGSVEGPAEAFNVHDAPFFTVWDAVTGKAVRCYFEESDRERIAQLVADKRIVSVSGTMRRNADGSPQRIRPVSLVSVIDQPLPGDWKPPAGLFGGIRDTREYLGGIRGE